VTKSEAGAGSIESRLLSAVAAIDLIFFSSGPLMPKYMAIWTICFGSTKSLGSEQNFSMVGPNSRQVMLFGILRPRPHSPVCLYCKQNSQTIIRSSLRVFDLQNYPGGVGLSVPPVSVEIVFCLLD